MIIYYLRKLPILHPSYVYFVYSFPVWGSEGLPSPLSLDPLDQDPVAYSIATRRLKPLEGMVYPIRLVINWCIGRQRTRGGKVDQMYKVIPLEDNLVESLPGYIVI